MKSEVLITKKFKNEFKGKIITNEALLLNEKTDELFEVIALWDSGATFSSISKELVEKLQLSPKGIYQTHSANDSKISNGYDIFLILNKDTNYIFPITVTIADNIHNMGIDMLIGMDVITQGDFAISTYNGETCFSFRVPSKGLIDFKEQEQEN